MLNASGSTKTVSAMPGGIGERILREIAFPTKKPNNRRTLEVSYHNGIQKCSVVTRDGDTLGFTLKLGVREGLFIEEIKGSRFSYRASEGVLRVGERLSPAKIAEVANYLIGQYVIGQCHRKRHRNRLKTWRGWRVMQNGVLVSAAK